MGLCISRHADQCRSLKVHISVVRQPVNFMDAPDCSGKLDDCQPLKAAVTEMFLTPDGDPFASSGRFLIASIGQTWSLETCLHCGLSRALPWQCLLLLPPLFG